MEEAPAVVLPGRSPQSRVITIHIITSRRPPAGGGGKCGNSSPSSAAPADCLRSTQVGLCRGAWGLKVSLSNIQTTAGGGSLRLGLSLGLRQQTRGLVL